MPKLSIYAYIVTQNFILYKACNDAFVHDTTHIAIQLSRYDMYITTKQEGYCLMSCSWAQKSVQLTSLVGSMHAFVVSAILDIMLNTAQHGFFLSVCSENCRA